MKTFIMEEKEFNRYLVNRYLEKKLTEDEFLVFITLMRAGELDQTLMRLMDEEIYVLEAESPLIVRKTSKSYGWYAAAASIALLISASLFIFRQTLDKPQPIEDIMPGGYKALLTLADGKKMILSDSLIGDKAFQTGLVQTAAGELIYYADEPIADVGDSTIFNVVSTNKGGKIQVVLADGSRIWLNAESSLRYPTNFSTLKQRKVELTGEAYFEVAPLKHKPFVLSTPLQELRVLGTHFNVSAYATDSFVKSTLVEGSVQVHALYNPSLKTILKPGQQAVLSSHTLNVSQVDTEMETAWKEGVFSFEDEPIVSIMNKLARWYDIEVRYEGNSRQATFGGKISMDRPLSSVLKLLASTGDLQFKREGRRITVME